MVNSECITGFKKEMADENNHITFKKLGKNEPIPYDLLLLADPSRDLIDDYLKRSDVFAAIHNGEILGVLVLFPLTDEIAEIKNLAVKPEYQGRGIGSYLIENAVLIAASNKQKSICIGTANSSSAQLSLYQKLGFEITEIKRDFFINNYPEPIYENGIQAKHMLVLTRQLNAER
jgi:ribosomal protein S18 acetylase RimI-like enzyme